MSVREKWLLGGLWSLLVVAALLARPAFPVDETRYLAVAWEMWVRADFLVPQLNGVPYSHKPPLLFWLTHLGWTVFGVNAWWPRLLPALAALGTLVLAARLARELWPAAAKAEQDRLVSLAVWLLFGTLAWSAYTTVFMFDTLLAFFVLLAMLGLLRAARDLGDRRAWAMVAASVALGILTKGPVMLLHILPLALAAPWWRRPAGADEEPRWRRRWYRSLGLAVSAGVLLALGWALVAAWHGGETYARELLWGQTEGRLVHAFAHARPVYWYLLWLPILLLPWSVWPLLWRSLARAWRLAGSETAAAGGRFLAAWVVPPFVGLSLVSGKQIHYLLPLLPGIVLFAARGIEPLVCSVTGHTPPRTLSLRPLAAAWFAAAVLLGVLGWRPQWLVPVYWSVRNEWTIAAGAAAAVAAWVLLIARRHAQTAEQAVRRLVLVAVSSPLFLVLLHVVVVRAVVSYFDVGPAARRLAEFERTGRPIAFLGKYHGQFHFAGRLQRSIVPLSGVAAAQDWIARHPDGVVIVYRRTEDPPAAHVPLPAVFSQHYLSGILEIRARAPFHGACVDTGRPPAPAAREIA